MRFLTTSMIIAMPLVWFFALMQSGNPVEPTPSSQLVFLTDTLPPKPTPAGSWQQLLHDPTCSREEVKAAFERQYYGKRIEETPEYQEFQRYWYGKSTTAKAPETKADPRKMPPGPYPEDMDQEAHQQKVEAFAEALKAKENEPTFSGNWTLVGPNAPPGNVFYQGNMEPGCAPQTVGKPGTPSVFQVAFGISSSSMGKRII